MSIERKILTRNIIKGLCSSPIDFEYIEKLLSTLKEKESIDSLVIATHA